MDKQKNKNFLITGAAGFIGSHLAERLSVAGYKVTGLDNLGNSSPVKLIELLDTIENITQKHFIKNRFPMQKGDVDLTFADIEKGKRLLNYQPQTTIQQGLKLFETWFVNQKEKNY